jgi:CRISPR type III-B/RAMP module-associated protein Cmr5
MATREQERARFALEKAESIRAQDDRDKYRTQLLKLPARLHANGLGQTVAFYLSAGRDKPEWQICDWLGQWLLGDEKAGGEQLMKTIVSDAPGGTARYRRHAAEARALSVWLKRFAEAFIEEGP